MFKTSYEEFIDNYACEMYSAIKRFESLDAKAILENNDDLADILNKIDTTYDRGVCDFFERALCGTKPLSIVSMANEAVSNMNHYGTEMKMILNALEDFVDYLSKYLPKEKLEFTKEDMENAFT